MLRAPVTILTNKLLVLSWPAVLPPKEFVKHVVRIFLKKGDALAKMFDGPELLHRVQSPPLSRRFPVSCSLHEDNTPVAQTSRSCYYLLPAPWSHSRNTRCKSRCYGALTWQELKVSSLPDNLQDTFCRVKL